MGADDIELVLRRDVELYGFCVVLNGERIDPREINWDPKRRVYTHPRYGTLTQESK